MKRLYNAAFRWVETRVELRYGSGQFYLNRPDAPSWLLAIGRWLCGKGGHDWRQRSCKWCGEPNPHKRSEGR